MVNAKWVVPTSKRILTFSLCFLVIILLQSSVHAEKIEEKNKRYIFYDVNPGEGFNLRRDVFMRIAVMVKQLNQQSTKHVYTLVLPPWGPLYHWQTRSLGDQSKIPWKQFFDVASISRYVPALDYEDYVKDKGFKIDVVYYLQGYKEGWKSGEFKEKMDLRECLTSIPYYKDEDGGSFKGPFWRYEQTRASQVDCLSVQGTTRIMRDFIEDSSKFDTIMLDRAENLLHEYFGGVEYWSVRRSMRFSTELVTLAKDFRAEKLNSTDEEDGTSLPLMWETHQAVRGNAKGGPYVCAHVRRKDYVYARKDQIPDLGSAVDQLQRKCEEHGVNKVFLATDAPDREVEQIEDGLGKNHVNLVKYKPTKDVLHKFKDGGAAILDQIICSHAKYFIGSYESTFTFRIQEEREIKGFSIENTFDMLCKSGEYDCRKGSIWKIAYPPKGSKSPKNHQEL